MASDFLKSRGIDSDFIDFLVGYVDAKVWHACLLYNRMVHVVADDRKATCTQSFCKTSRISSARASDITKESIVVMWFRSSKQTSQQKWGKVKWTLEGDAREVRCFARCWGRQRPKELPPKESVRTREFRDNVDPTGRLGTWQIPRVGPTKE